MKGFIKRFLSLVLICVMIAVMIPGVPVHAANQNQLNIVARADYLYGLKWTCKQTVSGWCGSYTFTQGNTYRLPYGQPINSGKYIGFGVSINDFLTAANTKGSVFYTSRSTYSGNGSSSVYYALDCSAFVSWCWGISRKTTYSITQVSTNLGAPTSSNISKIQLGDALNSRSVGHVVLVTGLTYSGSTLTKIEITEQTPPQLKRTTYTPAALASKYGSSYTIQRYSGSVPAAPGTTTTATPTNGYEAGYTGGMAGKGKIYAHGLDVSAWQGAALDFNAIKNAGYSYVILRAGTTNGKDSCFETYYTNARKAGLNIGAYYYSYATTVAGAQTDANNMLKWISGKTFEYPIYFDYEDASQNNLSSTMSQNICLTFCDAMAKKGYLTGIYTGLSRANSLPLSTICAKYEIWIARYYDYTYESLSPTYSTKYGMFQYTDRKYIGSKGPFDANVAYKDYPAIVKQYGFNGYGQSGPYLNECTAYSTHCTVVTTQSTPLNSQPRSAENAGSDTLKTAAAGETFTANALYRNTGGNYWYQVTLASGETAFLFSGHSKFVESVSTDLALSDRTVPVELPQGGSFGVSGAASALNNRLDEVDVRIYTADGKELSATTAPASGNLCDLSGLAVNLTNLETGSYWYKVVAKYSGHYAKAAQEIAEYSCEAVLLEARFTVGEAAEVTPEQDPYLEKCTVYPAFGTVVTTQEAPLNTLPSSTQFNGSQTIVTAAADQTFTAIALYCNTGSTYWYQVQLANGQTAFLSSTASKFVSSLNRDISLSNSAIPGTLFQGKNFQLGGAAQALRNQLGNLQVQIYTMDGQPVTSATVSNDLSKATLDFSGLAVGNYWYRVVADYSGSYATAAKERATYSDQVTLVETIFTVTDGLEIPDVDPGLEQDPYLARCTVYPAHCKVSATQETPLNTLPSSTQFNGSQTVTKAEAGQILTVKALYRNTGGNYWYQVVLDSGETAFLSSLYATYIESVSTDISLSDKSVPGTVYPGDSFAANGTAKAQRNRLDEVSVRVYSLDGRLLQSAEAGATGNLCDLSNVTLDFATLIPGTYLYQVVAVYSGHYAASATELADYAQEAVLLEAAFMVPSQEELPPVEQDPYLEKCTVYPAYCTVVTTQETPLNTLPSSTQFNGSETIVTAAADQTLTAIALYRNTGDTYWYQVQLADGQTAFLSSSHSKYVESIGTDLSLVDKNAPELLSKGDDFLTDGTAQALRNQLDEVQVQVYTNQGMLVKTAAVVSSQGNCDLSEAALDFSGLDVGTYVYTVIAKYSGNYASAPKEKATYNGYVKLLEATFMVTECQHNSHDASGNCTACGIFVDHSFVQGSCSNCGFRDDTYGYYLFGYINGVDYGFNADYENLGIYRFENGQLTVTFTEDSYVGVKTSDNLNWYMTSGWMGTAVTEVTLYNSEALTNGDKLFVPGNTELTFTLADHGDDTFTLSYVINTPEPTLSAKYPSLSFEDEVFLNVYFTAENLGDYTVADMGLLTWSAENTQGTVDDAEANIPGAGYSGGMYQVRTEGIPAKNLSDTIYFKVYLKLNDGSYVYTKLLSYSPKTYVSNILANPSAPAGMKALAVAMLNYGAAAQTFFGYKTDLLMNSGLTPEQKALVSDYTTSMIAPVGTVDSSKIGSFANSGGFDRKYPTVSFEGAFSINYYFTPSNTPNGNVRMYYWNAADYAAATTLTPANATGSIIMTKMDDGRYHAVVAGIAAKDLDGTIYVAGGYTSCTTSYCTGVLAYSIGSYCLAQANAVTAMQPFAQATAVYGYYAKLNFYSA